MPVSFHSRAVAGLSPRKIWLAAVTNSSTFYSCSVTQGGKFRSRRSCFDRGQFELTTTLYIVFTMSGELDNNTLSVLISLVRNNPSLLAELTNAAKAKNQSSPSSSGSPVCVAVNTTTSTTSRSAEPPHVEPANNGTENEEEEDLNSERKLHDFIDPSTFSVQDLTRKKKKGAKSSPAQECFLVSTSN